jgi:hypothetical protein
MIPSPLIIHYLEVGRLGCHLQGLGVGTGGPATFTQMVTKITLEDLRRELSVPDWWSWLRSHFAELKATRLGQEYMRFDKGPMKRLKEEVVPTLRMLERQFPGTAPLVRFPVDGSAADALARSSGNARPVPIQVTCDWGYDDERRLKIMHRDGFVHGSGPITNHKGRLETRGSAYSTDEVLEEFSATIRNRLAGKISHGSYPPGMWLVVHINDERLPPEALPQLLSDVKAVASGAPFAATFLVGSTDEKRICAVLDGTPILP